MATPASNEERLGVLEARVNDLVADDQRIEATLLEFLRRLEAKFDAQIAEGMSRADARALARAWSFTGITATALLGALLHIAVNL